MISTDVLTLNDSYITRSKKTKWFYNGEQECLELVFLDGNNLKCTKNHMIYTTTGWKEAQYVTSNDKIISSIRPGLVDYKNESQFTFNNLTYDRACSFLRIMGYISGVKNNSIRFRNNFNHITFDTKLDAINFQNDLMNISDSSVQIMRQKYNYKIIIPATIMQNFLQYFNFIHDRYIHQFPSFLFESPKWVIREYLKGFMSNCKEPCFEESTDKFTGLNFVQKRIYGMNSTFINNLKLLLCKLGINSFISRTFQNGDNYILNIENAGEFYNSIGFTYASIKLYKLAIFTSYLSFQKYTKEQYNSITRNTFLNIACNSKSLDKFYEFKKKYLSSPRDYLVRTDSLKYFTTFDRDMEVIPTYYVSVLKVCDIGVQRVYDIEVDKTHNYLANGIVVHNCIQDTSLLQQLVDHQLILITIIQLANVTYVPLGYLTTRGQSIKVYSQILRKARQMNFLAPHTNFNEDSNPIMVKTKEPHKIDQTGEYVSIDCGKSSGSVRNTIVNGVVSEIMDDNCIVILSDSELTREYYNLKLKYKNRFIQVSKMYTADDVTDDSFTGATVLSAKNGIHYENIAVLDFASLYPTCIISRNLCYSTILLDEEYRDLPDTVYETIEWDDTIEYKLKHNCSAIGKSGKSKGQVCGKQAFFEIDNEYYCRIHDPRKRERTEDEKFQKKPIHYKYTIIQKGESEKHKGVVPCLLEELYAERKAVKREMGVANKEGNKLLADILDSTQLAIKISLNSVYGYISRGKGNLIMKPLGQLTTYIGRSLIEQTKKYAEESFLGEIGVVTHNVETVSIDNMDIDSILLKFKCKD